MVTIVTEDERVRRKKSTFFFFFTFLHHYFFRVGNITVTTIERTKYLYRMHDVFLNREKYFSHALERSG